MKEGVKAKEPYMNNRVTSAETAVVGGAMTAGGIAGNYGLDRMLNRKGVKTPGRALLNEVQRTWKRGSKTSLNPIHVPYVAGKIASRSLKTVGIPLAAYGAFNVVKPGERVVRINLKNDVIKPSLRASTGLAPSMNAKGTIRAHRNRDALHKADLSTKETNRLSRRKQQGRYLSLAAGTLGLGALSLRAPEIARAATRIPKVKNLRSLKKLASYDAPSTKASNALGIAAIGLGSVGSFNYAAQQKLERKQVVKAVRRKQVKKAMTSRELDEKAMAQYVSLFPRPKLKNGEPRKEYHKRLSEWNTTGNTYAVSQRHARKELAAQPYRLARIKRGPYLDGGQRSLPERRAYALTKSFSKVSGIGKRDGVVDRGKAWARDKEVRQAKARRNHALDNTVLAGSALSASMLPASISLYNKGVKGVQRSPLLREKMPFMSDLKPIPIPKANAMGVRLKPLRLAGLIPGHVGRVARNPFVIGGASLAVGGPLVYRNSKELKDSKADLDDLQKKRRDLVGKRDDRFLRTHRDRISPEAERGYEYLRRGRNSAAAEAGVGTAAAGLSGFIAASIARHGGKVGYGLAGLAGAAAVGNGVQSVQQGRKAHRWNSKMGKIKAKGRERADAGVYAKDRQVPVGKTYVGGGVYRSLASLSPKARGTVARNIRSGKGFGASPQQRAADTLRGLASRQPNSDINAEAARRANALTMRRARTGNATSTSVPGLSVDARMPAGVRSTVESQAAGLKLKGPTTVRWNKEKKTLPGSYPNYTVDSPGPTGKGRSVVLSAMSSRGADPKIVRHELEHAVGGARKGRITSLKLRRMPNRSVQNEEARADAASMTVGGKRSLGTWYPKVFGDKSQYGRRFREITGRKARSHSVETFRRNTIANVPEYKSILSGKDGKGEFYQAVRQARENLKAAPDELTRRSGEQARRASRQVTRDTVGSLQQVGAAERLANRRDFFNKGLFPVPRPKLSMMPRRNSVRSSYTGTSRLGRKFTVSGSVR